jgi:hypothetical protein
MMGPLPASFLLLLQPVATNLFPRFVPAITAHGVA